jgi:hypothetical protein
MNRPRQSWVQTVAKGIWGHAGPHKWKVASDFVDSLSDVEMRQFLADYNAAKLNKSDEYPLLTAARKHKATNSLAAALLAGSQKRP